MDPPFENLSTVEDFLENDALRAWVTQGRPESTTLAGLVSAAPRQRDVYEQVVATFLILQEKQIPISDQQLKTKTADYLWYKNYLF